MLRTGAPWRDLPERFGPWSTAWNRFRRWTAAGLWRRLLEALQRRADSEGRLDWATHFVDGTVVRAHQHAAGAAGGQDEEALGWSRGGFSTKIHVRAEGGGRLKQSRRVATRYEKRARHFAAMLTLAAVLLWL